MRKIICSILPVLPVFFSSFLFAATYLYDDFNEIDETVVSSVDWHIPAWVSADDGTFIGRTQFRCTQTSSLPVVDNENAVITVESYNPTGFSFYGTDLISNQLFESGDGLQITVRAKMETSTGGITGGIFLYALKPDSTSLHDEIDFEFLTNFPNGVQTNIYSNEPLGVGHPQFISYPSGSITDYHTYQIIWLPDQVSWYVDGKHLRTETIQTPLDPMNFHLNIWVPAEDWPEAYDADLQPVTDESSNQIFSMSVDYVHVQTYVPVPQNTNLIPVIDLLLLNES